MYDEQRPVNALKKAITTLAHKCKAQYDSVEKGTDCAQNIVLHGNKKCNCYTIEFNNNCRITVLAYIEISMNPFCKQVSYYCYHFGKNI